MVESFEILNIMVQLNIKMEIAQITTKLHETNKAWTGPVSSIQMVRQFMNANPVILGALFPNGR